MGAKGSTSPNAARAKAGIPLDEKMVGVKGKRKADPAMEDDSGHENAQVKQPVQQHQDTAKRKMLGWDE